MRVGKYLKGFTATGAAMAMVLAGVAPAFAADLTYNAPTSESSIQNGSVERYLTAIGAHGSAVVGEYVGLSEQINQTYATSGNGVSTENYTTNPMFGIYGSDANENPDPYVANLFYKWDLKAKGMTAAADAVQNCMYNYIFDGYSGSCITADTKSLKNGTSIALSGRPDVIVTKKGNTNAFAEEIKTINGFKAANSKYYKSATDTYVGDENYKPVISEYEEVKTAGFIDAVYNAAEAAQKAYDYSWDGTSQQAKVALRYGYDAAMATAQKYEKMTRGSDLYVLSKIADGTVKKKTVAYVKSITGEGEDARFTLQANLDPTKSGESSGHILEPLNATCYNLANVLADKAGVELPAESKPGVTYECSVDELAKADFIIMVDADNMKYNFSGDKADTYTGVQKGDNNLGKDGDNGESSSRHYGDISLGHFKNQFYGPQQVTKTKVETIKDALKAAGHTKLAKKEILSCMQENASNCDGGSVDSMALHGIVNGFAYPELMNQLEQYGWFLDNIAHIKTSQVSKMVQILAQDLSLTSGVKMSDIKGYNATTSKKIEQQYDAGIAYWNANASKLKAQGLGYLEPSSRIGTISQKVTISTKTLSVKAGKTAAVKAKASTKFSFKKVSGNKKITVSKTGKLKVAKGVKSGTYKVKVTVSAAKSKTYQAATASKTIKVKVK